MAFTTKDGELIQDPIDEIERGKVATQCRHDLKLPMPTLIDGLDDKVNQAYNAWPDRLFLIDERGKIAYAGGRGPFFFSPDAWEAAIEALVGRARK